MISSASHSVNVKTLSAHRKRLVCVYCVAATRRSYTEIGKSMPQTPLQIYISYALGGAIPELDFLMQMRATVEEALTVTRSGSLTKSGSAFFTTAARLYQTWGRCDPNQS